VNASTLALSLLGVAIPGSLSVTDQTATFTPTVVLSADATYQVKVAAAIKDSRGNALGEDRSFSFSTRPSISAACASIYGGTVALVAGQDNSAVPTLAKPTKGLSFRDPAYGTCVTRLTDHANEPPVGFARNDYSRRQAYNADSSLILVYALDGFWHVYDGQSFAHVRRLEGLAGDAEPQWHPTDPRKLRFFPTNGAGGKILELDVLSNTSVVIADVASKVPGGTPTNFIWTKSEGSPSADHRYWCLMAEDAGFITRTILVYDLVDQRVVGSIAAPEDPDHVSMSPSGKWCVASYSAPRGVIAYTRDFTSSMQVAGNSEHSDIAIDESGDDVYVAVDYQSCPDRCAAYVSQWHCNSLAYIG
jgi:hypothetical protein